MPLVEAAASDLDLAVLRLMGGRGGKYELAYYVRKDQNRNKYSCPAAWSRMPPQKNPDFDVSNKSQPCRAISLSELGFEVVLLQINSRRTDWPVEASSRFQCHEPSHVTRTRAGSEASPAFFIRLRRRRRRNSASSPKSTDSLKLCISSSSSHNAPFYHVKRMLELFFMLILLTTLC